MAQKIKGITIEIGGDTTKLGKALEGVNSKTKDLKNELKGVNSLLKLDPSNVTLLKQKQDILNQSIATTKEKLKNLKDAQAQVQAQFEKGEITEEQFRDFQREIVATEEKLKSLKNELKEFGSVGKQQIENVAKKMEEAGGKVEAVGKKLTVASAGATIALTGIAKGAIDFETAFTGVTKTVDGTEEQLEEIKQGILDLSEVTASSSTEIAAVAEAAGQLGVSTDNILQFTEAMVRLGDSTNLSSDEAATAIAQLYNIMGSDINTVDQFGSSLVALGNNSATTEKDILNMASRIASSGKQIGLTEQEVLALATTLSSVGLEAEGGGSAISAVMTQIDKDVALNSDTLKVWADVAGLSVKDFKNLWENDAMSAIQLVVSGMGDASAGGENLNVILEKLGVTSLRQTDTMKRLSGASELMSDMVEISNSAWEENTALTDESNKRYETTEAKLQQMKNTITELCVKLGDILLPIIKKILDKISGFVNWLNNLDPTVQKIIVTVLMVVAALGPVVVTLGKIISSVGTILKILPMLTNPVTLIIAGIAALVAIFVTLWNKCEAFRNFWLGLWSAIKKVVQVAINVIKGIISAFAQTIKTIFITIPQWIQENIINPIFDFFSSAINSVISLFQNAWDFIKNIFITVSTWVNDNVVTPIMDLLTSVFNWIQENIVNPIMNVFSSIWNTLVSGAQTAWNGIKNIFSTVASFFGNIFSTAWSAVKKVFSTGGKIFDGIKDGIVNAFKSVVNAIIGGINKVVAIPFGVINSILKGIKNVDILGVKPFKGLIHTISVPEIPKLRSGGTMIGDGEAIMAEAGSPEMITMMNGKAIVRPLTQSDRKEVLSNNSSQNYTVNINNNSRYTSPAENERLFRNSIAKYRLRKG